MIFLILFTFSYFTFASPDHFVIDLTCRADEFSLYIRDRETQTTLLLTDIANGAYLRTKFDDRVESICYVTEDHFNVTHGFIDQSFPYSACGWYNVTDETYSTNLVYRLDCEIYNIKGVFLTVF